METNHIQAYGHTSSQFVQLINKWLLFLCRMLSKFAYRQKDPGIPPESLLFHANRGHSTGKAVWHLVFILIFHLTTTLEKVELYVYKLIYTLLMYPLSWTVGVDGVSQSWLWTTQSWCPSDLCLDSNLASVCCQHFDLIFPGQCPLHLNCYSLYPGLFWEARWSPFLGFGSCYFPGF